MNDSANLSGTQYPLLTEIYFYLTEGCNLRCRHCYFEPEFIKDGQQVTVLPFGLFKSIIEQAKPMGLVGVKLTGGEPLTHPQIHEIVELIKAEGLRLNMETNGVLCTPGLAREIAAVKGSVASVSLDGVDAETHEWVRGVKGCFDDAVEGIGNLVTAGLRPQIVMTLMRRNKDQMEAMVRLAESLDVPSIKFNILMSGIRREEMIRAGETLTIEECVELGAFVENSLSASTDLYLMYSHPMAFQSLGKLFKGNYDGCSSCGILGLIGVLADGSYAMCGVGRSTSSLVYGNARTDTLKDTWENHPVLSEIREGLPERFEGICAHCLMKEMCRGHCMAENYCTSNNIWSPFWYCEAAGKQGLFPDSRLSREAVQGRNKNCESKLATKLEK